MVNSTTLTRLVYTKVISWLQIPLAGRLSGLAWLAKSTCDSEINQGSFSVYRIGRVGPPVQAAIVSLGIEACPCFEMWKALQARAGNGNWNSRVTDYTVISTSHQPSDLTKLSRLRCELDSLLLWTRSHCEFSVVDSLESSRIQFTPPTQTRYRLSSRCRPISTCTIRYNTRCYINVRSKANMSQLNFHARNRQLESGETEKLIVENRYAQK